MHPGDRVWFVDSASQDDSVAIARDLGVEVVLAPRGKGRAIATALERCEEGYICLLDADQFYWTVNIPATLRATALASEAAMVLGSYSEERRRVIQPYVYWPLVDALFSDYGRRCDPTPLSGLRSFDIAVVPPGRLPPGYGIETHLNLAFAAAGRRIEVVDLGVVQGPLRAYANVAEVASDVSTAILDFAEGCGRLDPPGRAHFERWRREMLEKLSATPPPGADDREFLAELERLRARCSAPPQRIRT